MTERDNRERLLREIRQSLIGEVNHSQKQTEAGCRPGGKHQPNGLSVLDQGREVRQLDEKGELRAKQEKAENNDNQKHV